MYVEVVFVRYLGVTRAVGAITVNLVFILGQKLQVRLHIVFASLGNLVQY